MNCKVEKTEKANEVKLEITIEAEKFDNAMKKVYFQNAKYFNIPGFRKGKAPMNIVEKYYGAQIFYEDAFNEVATEAYEEALTENKIDNAKGVIFNVRGGDNLSLTEINTAVQVINDKVSDDANIIFGTVIDESLQDEMEVTVVATGVEE